MTIMNPKYSDDEYETVVEKSLKHASKLKKQGATNPARYSAQIEQWEDGRGRAVLLFSLKNAHPAQSCRDVVES
jgi:hypothetical protein